MLSSSLMLRRAQALVLVIALLAAPLALYARGVAADMSNCNGMCCLPQHHHATQPMPAEQSVIAQPAAPADSECHHHSAKASPAASNAAATSAEAAGHSCAFHCAMHSTPHATNFGLLAPIAPTKPSDLAAIRVAVKAARATAAPIAVTPSGFLASPFQPPRA